MALKVNRAAVSHAKSLIADGKVDKGQDWSFSAEDGNALLGKGGDDWKTFASWHLAQDTAEPQETKGRYKYPFGKRGKVYRKGVIAAKSRAAQQGEDAVSNAAAGLLDLIDRDQEDSADATVDPPGKEKQKPQPGNATAGTLTDDKECPDCKGTGKIGDKTCKTCGGTGNVPSDDAKAPHAVETPASPVNDPEPKPEEEEEEEDSGRKQGKDKRDSRGHLLALKGVQRWDRVMAPDWMTKPFEKTPEGFLKGRAIITSTGVFPYKDAAGNVRRELRVPDEVFHPDHLESLKLKPVTNEHPSEEVTPENIGKYQVGQLGTNPSSTHMEADWGRGQPYGERTDGYHLACDMLITNKDAIADVEAGKRQLSCGYTCDLEKADDGANHMGMPYDYIQRNIRLNHVAIVDKARAGDAARIRMDSADAELVVQEGAMKQITLDGTIKIDVDERVAEHMTKLQARVDAFTAEKAADKKTADAALATEKARADAAEAALKQARDPATIKTAVDAAVRLEGATYLAQIKRDEKMTDLDVMKQVIQKTDPAANFEGKDAVYIQARFDAAVAILEAQAGSISDIVRRGGPSRDDDARGTRDDESMYDSEDHRKAMIKRMNQDSRDEVGTNRSNVHLEKNKFAAGYQGVVA